MSTVYYVMVGETACEEIDVPSSGRFDWKELRDYAKEEYGSSATLVSEYQLESSFVDDYCDDDFVSWDEVFV